MRFLFLILSFFNLGAFANVKIDDFNNNIHQGYELYEVIVDESNQYYTLKVAWGVNNDKINYSIYFYSEKAKDLNMIIIYNNKQYTLPKDERGDIAVEAFGVRGNSSLKLVIFDKGKHVYTTIDLPTALNKEEFLLEALNNVEGLNKGLKISSLKVYRDIKNFSIVVFALFSVIILLSATIVVIVVTKKGVFNQEYDDIIRYTPEERPFEYIFLEPDVIKEDTNNVLDLEEDDEPRSIYNRMRQYDFDDDNNYDFDVFEYLTQKGFNANYEVLSEAEKDLIMLELMRLRDEKVISLEQYNQEVIKLWS